MKEDFITTENVSTEFLKSIFDDAFIDSKIENDEVLVRENIAIRIQIDSERKDRIRLVTIYNFEESSSEVERLRCVNGINSQYIIVGAFAYKDMLVFYHDLIISGGIPKKNLVITLKRFSSIPSEAVNEFGQDIVI